VGVFDFPELEGFAVQFGVAVAAFVVTGGLIAPAHRPVILLLFAALTCFGAFFWTGEVTPARVSSIRWLEPEDVVVLVLFAAWATGTALSSALVMWVDTAGARRHIIPIAAASKGDRYKGTAPYQDKELDRKTFFGREREARSLLSLVLAERLVVLFAKSGMGKSSLINAGLVQPLRDRGFLPLVVRLNDQRRALTDALFDGIRRAAEDAGVDLVEGKTSSLWTYFRTTECWSRADDLLRPVLILDQFEEIFTLHGTASRRGLIEQLGELIRGRLSLERAAGERLHHEPADVRVVIAMREDFLANLEELAKDIPAILRSRFRLGPLNGEAAREAIVEPAKLESDVFETTRFSYQPEAVERMIGFLARRRVGDVSADSDEVEPVQLQLICHYLEETVRARQRTGGLQREISISESDLGGNEELEQVLEGFYDRTIAAVRPRRKAVGIRRLCERRLISASGRRLTEDRDEIERRFRLSDQLLRQLVDARLLRAESRLGGTFYEISHDRLIEPIQHSRRKRIARQRRMALLAVPLALAMVWGDSANARDDRWASGI